MRFYRPFVLFALNRTIWSVPTKFPGALVASSASKDASLGWFKPVSTIKMEPHWFGGNDKSTVKSTCEWLDKCYAGIAGQQENSD
jgi:hypothetical protein